MIKPLSRTEGKALRCFSYGVSYEETANRLGLTVPYIHTLAYHIRLKTGIKDTRDPEECKAWFQGVKNYLRAHFDGPTRTQLNIMTLMTQHGMDYQQIAQRLELSIQTVQNHASMGCKRAGITGQGHHRTKAMEAYLKTLKDYPHSEPPPRKKDPMDEY